MGNDELVKVMARASCALDKADPDEIMPDGQPRWCDRVAHCKAALAAIKANGFAVVPVEPTEGMLDASWKQTGESKEMRARTHAHYARHYRAMIAATQDTAP